MAAEINRVSPLSSVLLFVAGLMLAVALLLPWYSMSVPANSAAGSTPYSPGPYTESFSIWQVDFHYPTPPPAYCQPRFGANCTDQYGTWSMSYSSARLPDLGALYNTVGIFATVGAAGSGGIGTTLFIGKFALVRRRDSALLLVLVGASVMFALAGPAVLAVGQPGAISNDWTEFAPAPFFTPAATSSPSSGCTWVVFDYGGAGWASTYAQHCPSGSFFGSDTGTDTAWGPGAGWYLAIAAGALILASLILLLRHRRDVVRSGPAGDGPRPSTH